MTHNDTFLHEVVNRLASFKTPISRLVIILPSKRAGNFLKEHIKKQYPNQTLVLPVIYSIEEFVAQLSGLQSIDSTTMLFEFYTAYLQTFQTEEKESFETFSTWAQTLVNDFNEIDRYLVDQKAFFSYLSEIKVLEHWSLGANKSAMIERYLAFWKRLPHYYMSFQESLLTTQRGHQGLQYRTAARNIQKYADETTLQHVFVGFNALNQAEQNILHSLLEADKGTVYWDMDAFFYGNAVHDVSLFLRRYVAQWPFYKKNKPVGIHSEYTNKKNIDLIGVSQNIGQAKYAGEILKRFDKNELNRTAIVLSDESLLMPILNSLPSTVNAINITMGLPLKEVPLSYLFESLFTLHRQWEHSKGYYFKNVLNLVTNESLFPIVQDYFEPFLQNIRKNNLVYLSFDSILLETPSRMVGVAMLLFKPWENVLEFIARFHSILKLLKEALNEASNALEKEYCYRFYMVFNKLTLLENQYNYIKTLSGLQTVYLDILNRETLDFRGEPFQGLQLMGMLESRCLDFENVIITSVNEGVLPAGKSMNSFIPYDLKKLHDLPTYKEKDAIYAYHFYRLIQRAKNVFILYNTEADSLNKGEKSRFVMQLEMAPLKNHSITHYIVAPETKALPNTPIKIKKNKAILEQLKVLGTTGFSPSALASYLRDPMDFYRQYILGIRDEQEVEETIAANTLGTVVHNTLENFYKPLVGAILTEKDIEFMVSNINDFVTREFKKVYSKMDITSGKNLIIYEVAKRYIANFLSLERTLVSKGNTIKIVGIERTLKAEINWDDWGFPILIKGKVDRIDEFNGQLRIIDYKTGKVLKNEVQLKTWEDFVVSDKHSKALQILTYAYMLNEVDTVTLPIQAGIISFKNLGAGFLKFEIKDESLKNGINCIDEHSLTQYRTVLKALLTEIYNPEIPFQPLLEITNV